jgi:hypothetical protein
VLSSFKEYYVTTVFGHDRSTSRASGIGMFWCSLRTFRFSTSVPPWATHQYFILHVDLKMDLDKLFGIALVHRAEAYREVK